MNLSTRLEQLCAILSIPLRDNWEPWGQPESNSVYRYWKVLGILSEEEYQAVFENKALTVTPTMLRYFKGLESHFLVEYYKEEAVIDVGSGFGFITIWLLLSGAANVYSIGDPERIGFIDRLYQQATKEGRLPTGKLSLKPSFVQVGDTTLFEGLPPASAGLVVLNDTLEHITPRIFPSLVAAAYHDLRPNGRFISRQQNTDSPKMLRRLQALWETSEKHEFVPQRLKLIQKKLPQISEKNALQLAKTTRGLDRIGFHEAIATFDKDGIFPSHGLGMPPIDVDIDVPYEGDTGIERIFNEFKKAGFRSVRVYPDWRTSRKTAPFQSLVKLFPQPFMRWHWGDQTSIFNMSK